VGKIADGRSLGKLENGIGIDLKVIE